MEVSNIILIMSMIYYNYPENIMNIHQATQVNETLLTTMKKVRIAIPA